MEPRLIPLTKGQFAIVDAEDYEWLSQHKWYAYWHARTQSYYACRNQNIAPPGEKWKNTVVRMHREILGLKRGDPRRGDHQDGNTLNYQRHNLRIATNSQNAMNRKKTVANTSGHKGVYLRKDKIAHPWGVFVKVNGKMIHCGFYATKQEAIAVRIEAEKKYYGEFARVG